MAGSLLLPRGFRNAPIRVPPSITRYGQHDRIKQLANSIWRAATGRWSDLLAFAGQPSNYRMTYIHASKAYHSGAIRNAARTSLWQTTSPLLVMFALQPSHHAGWRAKYTSCCSDTTAHIAHEHLLSATLCERLVRKSPAPEWPRSWRQNFACPDADGRPCAHRVLRSK